MVKIASCLLGLLFGGGAILAAGTILVPRNKRRGSRSNAVDSDPTTPQLAVRQTKPLLKPAFVHRPARRTDPQTAGRPAVRSATRDLKDGSAVQEFHKNSQPK